MLSISWRLLLYSSFAVMPY